MMDASPAPTATATELHSLKHSWNLWAHLPHDPDWTAKSYKKVFQFKTVEETIAMTEMLPPDLIKNCMWFIMKAGIVPQWEDPKNRNGGCFSYKVSNKNLLDIWKNLTYVLVGETISTQRDFVAAVTGITVSPKKNFCIVKIWMTNCDHQNPQKISEETGLSPHGCLFKKHTPEF